MSKLKDYCVKITDGEHGSIKDDPSGEYYFLNNNNITEDGITINPTDRKMSKTDFEKIHKRTQLSKGDVVIATCGTIGKTHIISDDVINYDFSRSVGIIKCNKEKLLPEFLCFYLKSPIMQRRISYLCEGAVQKHFYIGAMSELEVDIPDIPIQQKIVNVLSVIEKKIQINKSICSDLGALAQEIYDYWFVQFDFPNENGKPYKSNGGKMVWNKELKREIPENWSKGSFGDLIASINTGLNPRDNFVLNTGGSIRYLTVKNLSSEGSIDFSSCDFIDENARSIVHKRSDVSVGDILFASISPFGRCHLVLDKPNTWDINESVFSIRPNKHRVTSTYVYMSLMQDYVVKTLEHNSAGSVFKGIRISELQALKTIIPNKTIIDMFDDKVNPIFAKRNSLFNENQQLLELRDFLLPLLMNGQIKIGE